MLNKRVKAVMQLRTAYRIANSIPKTFDAAKVVNRFKVMDSYWRKSSVSAAFPTVINVETTNRCNFRCIMCPINEMKRPVGNMSFKLWKKIVDEAAGKTEMIIPSVFGEPMLHPRIVDFVKYAKNAGIDVHMTTNGSLLTKEKAKSLIKTGIDYILICIDGATKPVYEKIRVGGKFEQVMENARTAIRVRDKLNADTLIALQLIELRSNSKQVEKFVSDWKQSNVDRIKIKQFQNWGGQISEHFCSFSKTGEISVPCDYLWRIMVIYWNGDVTACCRDIHGLKVVGNVAKQSIAEAWNSTKMQKLRKTHAAGKRESIELCKGCDHIPNKNLFAAALFDISTLSKI